MSVDDMRVAPTLFAPHPRVCCRGKLLLLLLLVLLPLLLLIRGKADVVDEHERQLESDAGPEGTKAGGAKAPAGETWSEATAAAVATHPPKKLALLIV